MADRQLHDLRSTLAIVVANVDVLLGGVRGELTPSQAQCLHRVLEAADRIDEGLLALMKDVDASSSDGSAS